MVWEAGFNTRLPDPGGIGFEFLNFGLEIQELFEFEIVRFPGIRPGATLTVLNPPQ